MNDSLLAMCAVLEIAQHERERLRSPDHDQAPKPAPTRAIAKRLTGFDRGLELLMRHLVNDGIVVGVRGPGGGHRLARGETEITLRQIRDAVEMPILAEVREAYGDSVIPNFVQEIVDDAQREETRYLDGWTAAMVLNIIYPNETGANAVAPEPPQCHIPVDAYSSDQEMD